MTSVSPPANEVSVGGKTPKGGGVFGAVPTPRSRPPPSTDAGNVAGRKGIHQ